MADPYHPRHYTDEFKKQIVQLYEDGKTAGEMRSEYDLSHSTLHRWVEGIRNSGSTHAADNRIPEQNELTELRKQNTRLRMEVDVSEHAAPVFARKRAWYGPTPVVTRYRRNAKYWARPSLRTTGCWSIRRRIAPTRWRSVWRDSGGGYGSRKLKAVLEREDVTASRRRICRIMRESGMASAYARPAFRPRKSKVNEAALPNILNREFHGHAPHTHIASDLTYVRVGGECSTSACWPTAR